MTRNITIPENHTKNKPCLHCRPWWGGQRDRVTNKRARWPCIVHLITRQVWVNWPFGSKDEVQYWFSRWRPSWSSNQNNFSYFQPTSHLDTSNAVWVHCHFGSGEKAENRYSTRLLGWPSWISDQYDFSYFLSTSHPDTPYQILSQWAFLIGRQSSN